jgi:very-short-patch-repair endonuclease
MLGQTGTTARVHAIGLRRQPTDAERVLWRHLRGRRFGVKFRRQHPYLNDVLDFVCLEHKLVVEVDGSQRAGSHGDAERDRKLVEGGIRVLRFWDHDVLTDTTAVLDAIHQALNPSPPPTLPLKGRVCKERSK